MFKKKTMFGYCNENDGKNAKEKKKKKLDMIKVHFASLCRAYVCGSSRRWVTCGRFLPPISVALLLAGLLLLRLFALLARFLLG